MVCLQLGVQLNANVHDIQSQDCHLFCPGMLRRCCSGQRWSSFAAVALNQPVINSSYTNTHTHTDPVSWSMGGLCTDLFKCRITYLQDCLQFKCSQNPNTRTQESEKCCMLKNTHTHYIPVLTDLCTDTQRDSLGGRDDLKAESSVLFTVGLHCA